MTYEVTNETSGRIRSFQAPSWGDVEAQLIKLGLDPDEWAILSIKE